MTNMQCEQFERILEEQEEGALPQTALIHLEGCDACRALAADFTAIHDLAGEIGAEGVAPPERVWISLRNQLEAERIIQEPRGEPTVRSAPWWAAFQRPGIAGAFLTLVLIGAAVVSYQWGSPQSATHLQLALQPEVAAFPSAESVFRDEVLTVGSNEFPGSRRQGTAVADSIRRNLRIVDNFITICEKSVREQPDNEMAREYLYGAYQQKAELLASAMNRTGGLQ